VERARAAVAPKGKFGHLERRVDEFCSICEKILLRALLFGCFIYEAGRFAMRMLK
jgi:hypothetical protein